MAEGLQDRLFSVKARPLLFPLGVGTHTWLIYVFSFTSFLLLMFTVEMGDTLPPVVSDCPSAGVSVTAPAGATSATATWTVPSAVDDSGGTVTVTSNRSPGDSFPVGTTQVTYTFRDPSQNFATCTFSVTVTGKFGAQLSGQL